MAKKKEQAIPEQEETLEEAMESLQQLIQTLDEGELSLEESFQLYRDGMQKLAKCETLLDRVEKELQILEEG